ncbi:518_t:CDS:2, partial [Entrophospora sp. SA101]
NPFLKKHDCAMDWAKSEMKLHCNGKDFIIPVTMHKVENELEVHHVNAIPSISEETDTELKKKRMSYEELEKSLYITLKSKAEINDLCEKLQMRYEKLLLRSKDK